LVIVPTPKGLMLYAAFFEAQAATIVISNERDHWQNIGNDDGVVHVISPGLRKYAGPVKLSAFITHRMLSLDPALKDLEDQERRTTPRKPRLKRTESRSNPQPSATTGPDHGPVIQI
jgi:hypothetical protein